MFLRNWPYLAEWADEVRALSDSCPRWPAVQKESATAHG